jgi:hypothetical protein
LIGKRNNLLEIWLIANKQNQGVSSKGARSTPYMGQAKEHLLVGRAMRALCIYPEKYIY